MKRVLVVVEKVWSGVVEILENVGDNVVGNREKVGISEEWLGWVGSSGAGNGKSA